jgi:hypothetical protein
LAWPSGAGPLAGLYGTIFVGFFVAQAQGHDKQVFLVGVRPEVEKPLRQLRVLELLPADHHHVTRLDALREAAAVARVRQGSESIQIEKSGS